RTVGWLPGRLDEGTAVPWVVPRCGLRLVVVRTGSAVGLQGGGEEVSSPVAGAHYGGRGRVSRRVHGFRYRRLEPSSRSYEGYRHPCRCAGDQGECSVGGVVRLRYRPSYDHVGPCVGVADLLALRSGSEEPGGQGD